MTLNLPKGRLDLGEGVDPWRGFVRQFVHEVSSEQHGIGLKGLHLLQRSQHRFGRAVKRAEVRVAQLNQFQAFERLGHVGMRTTLMSRTL